MELLLDINIKPLPTPIRYTDRILLIGSCFTEHIGNSLAELKFTVLQNPNGILFGPDSVQDALHSYIHARKYSEDDLFQYNELWQSWHHHSRFSGTDLTNTLKQINESQEAAHEFLRSANWLIITLGSAFTYRITKDATPGGLKEGDGVANCHRAPSSWFRKELLTTGSIISLLEGSMAELKKFNPSLRVLFTISPVRHIRDGVVENNRSKARLITAVHDICDKFDNAFYFPAYELVIDVLRDYRFYDIDLVHPNYAATHFVLEKFTETCIAPEDRELMKELRSIVTARKHRSFQPHTKAHQQFLQTHLEKTRLLMEKYPFLDLSKEQQHFGGL